MMRQNIKYVVYSTDDNYAPYAGTSIVSLAKNNLCSEFVVFIIAYHLSDANKEQLLVIENLCNNIKIEFVDFERYSKLLKLNMPWEISISSYARLFLAEILPTYIDTVLYLDCDTVVVNTLDDLFNIDIKDVYVAGVEDTVSVDTKNAVGISDNHLYVNAGVLLVNLKMWRQKSLTSQFLKFIAQHNGCVIHHDQGVINGVCAQFLEVLPVKYNVTTMLYMLSYKNMTKFAGLNEYAYSESEIVDGCMHPTIIHYTPCFTVRPWVKGCCHPQKHEYDNYYRQSPWKNCETNQNTERWYRRFYGWTYRNLPFAMAQILWGWKKKR